MVHFLHNVHDYGYIIISMCTCMQCMVAHLVEHTRLVCVVLCRGLIVSWVQVPSEADL